MITRRKHSLETMGVGSHGGQVPFSPTEVVMLASAPVLMVAVALVERRSGPRVAGMVAAAPSTALVGLLLVSSDLGEAAGHDMAIRMGGYLSAQVTLAVIIAALVGRVGFPRALVLGAVAFAGLARLAIAVPAWVAVVAGLLMLGAGRRLVRAPDIGSNECEIAVVTGAWMVAVRATVSLASAVALLVIAHQFGPAAGGAVGAFPTFTVTLCAFICAAAGDIGVRHALTGMVQGLPAYFSLVLTFGLTAQQFGAVGGAVAGTVACALCYLAPTGPDTSRNIVAPPRNTLHDHGLPRHLRGERQRARPDTRERRHLHQHT